jgi:hypothetical protein
MTTALMPELAAESARVLRRATARAPEGLGADDVEDTLRFAVAVGGVLKGAWIATTAGMRRGKEAGAAERDVARLLPSLAAWQEVAGLAAGAAELCVAAGLAVCGVEETRAVAAQLAAMHAEAEGLLELLRRPAPTFDRPEDREQVRRAREAFERGEGRDAEEVLRERGWKEQGA